MRFRQGEYRWVAQVQLIGPVAAGTLNASFTDVDEEYLLRVEHGVLNYTRGRQAADADATLLMTREALDKVVLGEAKIEGNPAKLGEFLALLDTFEFWFDIVTP